MALKECIRALDRPGQKHVPFRQSKMTMMLRDSFILAEAKVIMIVCVAPALSKTDHTLITLKYARDFRENQKALQGYEIKKHFDEGADLILGIK